MKDEDFIERKEKVLLAALGKSWLWKASRLIIGIIPPVGALVMLVNCTLLSFGIRAKLTEWIFDWIVLRAYYINGSERKFRGKSKKEYKNTPAVKKSSRWGNKWKPL